MLSPATRGEKALLESVLRETLLKSKRSKLLVFPKQQCIETTARVHEQGLNTSMMEVGATRPLISAVEVEEVRVAARRAPGLDNQGAPMETEREGMTTTVVATAAVERRCDIFSSVALWPMGGVMQSTLGKTTPMESDDEAAFVKAEITCGTELGMQLGGDIFDAGDEGSLLESVLRGKLLKSMRPRLPVPETTARVTAERELDTSTDNWMENGKGATRQLISAAAVEDVLEAAGRGPDNHGEPMETESEERVHARSGTLVGAGGRPKPANWSNMSKGQRAHWYKRRHGWEG